MVRFQEPHQSLIIMRSVESRSYLHRTGPTTWSKPKGLKKQTCLDLKTKNHWPLSLRNGLNYFLRSPAPHEATKPPGGAVVYKWRETRGDLAKKVIKEPRVASLSSVNVSVQESTIRKISARFKVSHIEKGNLIKGVRFMISGVNHM